MRKEQPKFAPEAFRLVQFRGAAPRAASRTPFFPLHLTFKENTPDLRNSRVVDIVDELRDYDIGVDVHDPWADPEEARRYYGVDLVVDPEPGAYAGIVLAVAHRQFVEWGAERIRAFGARGAHVLYDLKYVLDKADSDLRL